MTNEEKTQDNFGCNICWPADPDLAWNARSKLIRDIELFDESHFHVMILSCNGCTQRFISVFTETIDWVDGEDPQYWTLLPITDAEATNLIQKRSSLTEDEINALGPGRRSLRRDYPKGETPYTFWSNGVI
ncbi:MAG: hypothetical protein H6937_09205 [Burkholderiales bacterium]|nr:hypothetical protein [Burkholderiales bacterium]